MIEELLKLGASARAVDGIGRTALHYLVQTDKDGSGTNWFLSQPVKSDLDMDAMTSAGVTPLMLAVKMNNE